MTADIKREYDARMTKPLTDDLAILAYLIRSTERKQTRCLH